MKKDIKNLLNESLRVYNGNKDLLANEILGMYENTKLKDNKKFLSESIDLFKNNTPKNFIKHLFESAEMFDALLDICVLTFSSENTKLGGNIATFSLPAGWSCPFADVCLKKVHRDRVIDPEKKDSFHISKRTGKKIPYKGDVKVEKGKDAEFDCYAANQEMQYDAVRANRWHNYDLLKEAGDYKAQAELIIRSLKHFFDNDGVKDGVRIHESGDFYNGEYLRAWIETARAMPDIKFYAYTKSIPFVKKFQEEIKGTPNLSITLSKGGKRDRDLETTDFKESHVFNSPEEVLKAGLLIDLDDELAKGTGGKDKNFALLVHGTQAKGEMSQTKRRNETFMAFWKYRDFLNRNLKLDPSYILSKDEANDVLGRIDKLDPSKHTSNLKFIKKLLNYVVKYHDYGFSNDLVNILQPKYRP